MWFLFRLRCCLVFSFSFVFLCPGLVDLLTITECDCKRNANYNNNIDYNANDKFQIKNCKKTHVKTIQTAEITHYTRFVCDLTNDERKWIEHNAKRNKIGENRITREKTIEWKRKPIEIQLINMNSMCRMRVLFPFHFHSVPVRKRVPITCYISLPLSLSLRFFCSFLVFIHDNSQMHSLIHCHINTYLAHD